MWLSHSDKAFVSLLETQLGPLQRAETGCYVFHNTVENNNKLLLCPQMFVS